MLQLMSCDEFRVFKFLEIYISHLFPLSTTFGLWCFVLLIRLFASDSAEIAGNRVRLDKYILDPFVINKHGSMQEFRSKFPKLIISAYVSTRVDNFDGKFESISRVDFLNKIIWYPFVR